MMFTSLRQLVLLSATAFLAVAHGFEPARLQIEAPGFDGKILTLQGAEARKQLLITATDAKGAVRDLTSTAQFEATPSGIVRIDRGGLLVPVADGETTLTVIRRRFVMYRCSTSRLAESTGIWPHRLRRAVGFLKTWSAWARSPA